MTVSYRIAGYDALGRLQYDDRNPPADLDTERERLNAERLGGPFDIVRYGSELLAGGQWVPYSPRGAADSLQRVMRGDA